MLIIVNSLIHCIIILPDYRMDKHRIILNSFNNKYLVQFYKGNDNVAFDLFSIELVEFSKLYVDYDGYEDNIISKDLIYSISDKYSVDSK